MVRFKMEMNVRQFGKKYFYSEGEKKCANQVLINPFLKRTEKGRRRKKRLNHKFHVYIGNTKQKSYRNTNIRYAPKIVFPFGFLCQTYEILYEKYETIFDQYFDYGTIGGTNNHNSR